MFVKLSWHILNLICIPNQLSKENFWVWRWFWRFGPVNYIISSIYWLIFCILSFILEPQKGIGNKTQPESKCPELLANYCDMLLRKTPLSKRLTADDIESKLKDVVCFFLWSSFCIKAFTEMTVLIISMDILWLWYLVQLVKWKDFFLFLLCF